MISPFEGSTNISYGTFDPNRTSNLSLHYPDGMLLTPWPILIATSGLSLILGLIAYISAALSVRKFEQGYAPKTGGMRVLVPLAALFITTIRTISFVVIAIRRNHIASLPPASSMLIFLVSIIPNINNLALPTWANIVAGFDYIASAIAMANILLTPRRYHYGQMELSGGNCPAVANVTCGQFTGVIQAGCQSNMTQTAAGLVVGINALNPTEELMKILGMLYNAFLLLYVVAIVLGKFLAPFLNKVPDRDFVKQQWAWVKVFSMVSLVLAILVTIVVVPEHAAAESSPATYSIFDGFRPLVPVNGSHSTSIGSSWTDCFDLHPPADRLGFLEYWWDTKSSAVVHVLAWM